MRSPVLASDRARDPPPPFAGPVPVGLRGNREPQEFARQVASHKSRSRFKEAARVDQEVVVDQGLVSRRKPDDIPSFAPKLIEEIREGRHEDRQSAASESRTQSRGA
jgi:hypothetical protein